MGMDVVGDYDNYFRANVWTWRPLWWLCSAIAPDLTSAVTYAQSNDGDGLKGPGARALAERLTDALDSGAVAKLIAEREAYLAELPDEECDLCESTGVRTITIGDDPGTQERRRCGYCKGKGTVRPFETHYSVDEATVKEFRDFLAASGGFEIW